MFGHIYLLQTRESIKNHENIYKIGRTSQDGLKRFQSYPKGSELILHMQCCDPVTTERHLISLFEQHFTKVELYGNEYFQGNLSEMTTLFCNQLHYACTYPHSIEKYKKEILSYKLQLEEANKDSRFLSELVDKYKHDLKSTQVQLDNLHKEYELLKIKNDELNFIVNSCEISSSDSDSKENSSQYAQQNDVVMIDSDESTDEDSSVDNEKQKKVVADNKNDLVFSKCDKVFSRKDNLIRHESKCDGYDKLQCKICLATFASRHGKWKHKTYVKCSPPIVTSGSNLNVESENQKLKNKFKCYKCSPPPKNSESKYSEIIGKLHC